jgi:hypothetical protein
MPNSELELWQSRRLARAAGCLRARQRRIKQHQASAARGAIPQPAQQLHHVEVAACAPRHRHLLRRNPQGD